MTLDSRHLPKVSGRSLGAENLSSKSQGESVAGKYNFITIAKNEYYSWLKPRRRWILYAQHHRLTSSSLERQQMTAYFLGNDDHS